MILFLQITWVLSAASLFTYYIYDVGYKQGKLYLGDTVVMFVICLIPILTTFWCLYSICKHFENVVLYERKEK